MDENWAKCYKELDKMSQCGRYNLWGADKYLANKYNIDEHTATKILLSWTRAKYDNDEDDWRVIYND